MQFELFEKQQLQNTYLVTFLIFFQKWRLEIISVEFSHYSSANFRCWETKKKSFFYDSLSSLQQLSLKKSDKKSSFLLLIGFIYLTWHSKDHVILFFWPSRVFLQKDPHFKVSSIENTGQSSFFSEEKKEWLWGLLYLLVFLLLSKSLELFELIHFGMAKNHDDAFEVFSLSPALRIALSCTTTTTSSTVVMAIDSSVR